MSVTMKGRLEISNVLEGKDLELFDSLHSKEALLMLKGYEDQLRMVVKDGMVLKPNVDVSIMAWVDDDRNRVEKKSHFDKILEMVEQDIKEAEEQAAKAGIRQLPPRIVSLKHDMRLINCGRSFAIPYEWDEHYGKRLDTEWSEYKRLHEKFSGERL